MILDAATRWGVDLAKSYMIGDRWRDVGAGNAAGCKVFFVDYGYDEVRPHEPYRRVTSLGEAVDLIIREEERSVKTIEELKVKIFADGADKAGMLEMYAKPYIKGMTTNPTLMRKAGIADYRAFAKDILAAIPDRPISFEVFPTSSAKWSARPWISQAGEPTSTSRSQSPTRVASPHMG